MSSNEPGPKYYYNDPTGTPYHDPAWYQGNKDDDDEKDKQRIEFLSANEEAVIKLNDSEGEFIYN